MSCAWDAYLKLLPVWLREEVDRKGKGILQELRLRIGQAPKLLTSSGIFSGSGRIMTDDLAFVVNAASKYSPWCASGIKDGYITAQGGHRIGVCGDVASDRGSITGLRSVTSLNLRVARDFPGISANAVQYCGSVLILGPPGSGKTTLLRDLIRQISNSCQGNVSVVDERGELFPSFDNRSCFSPGDNTDILTGCRKVEGIEMLLRTMNPDYIAVDEITAKEDCAALISACWCGVKLLATAHASSVKDLQHRCVYRSIIDSGLFHTAIVLSKDKSWRAERIP